ncbi:MAG: class II fumarate hydratase [Synergistaceae bacterium]|nr:class II fumarate hydratase [Synergistaceae bacterium]MBQ3758309.1 class II fumarate hydratase [Synergistaceae bacterium]MBQ6113985.1 class II fumarate hydratase [Synergistaceae bacterium]MBQ6419182.1 class II fumarate hydratase [Synergistaceae bacterium]
MYSRTEHDSMGEIQVPSKAYWGAQTQRSFENFTRSAEKMPLPIIQALAIVKKASAVANAKLGRLDQKRKDVISIVCDEILSGKLNSHFPLIVWQTGSGTQTNMNVNEVIANRGNVLAGGKLLHPNDHVNMSQSSNDTFPAAMHIAAVKEITGHLFPALDAGKDVLGRLMDENVDIIKTGRTHLQDAVPITFGQEISGWHEMLDHDKDCIAEAMTKLHRLALGGTAVGTGLNAPKGFAEEAAEEIARLTGQPFITSPNKFHALTSQAAMSFAHGALKALAADMMKIANDIRWLASGPRCGLGEIFIPENEPGSSIMPGKVNPTQCEALAMAAVQVMGNDAAIGFAASQGNFELNVFLPVIAYNFLQSVNLLSETFSFFTKKCLDGIRPNIEKMNENLAKSLMLVTALNPHTGYDNAAKIAKNAHEKNITLKESAVSLGILTPEEYDKYIVPSEMV